MLLVLLHVVKSTVVKVVKFTSCCVVHWSNYRPVWTTAVEVIQKRVLRVIFGGSSFTSQSYYMSHFVPSWKSYRYLLAEINWLLGFFQRSCLHYLIHPKRDNPQSAKLRKTPVYDISFARTNKFKNSFLLYALHNYLCNLWFVLYLCT